MSAPAPASPFTPLRIALGASLAWLVLLPLPAGAGWSLAGALALLVERPGAAWLPVIAFFVAAGAASLADRPAKAGRPDPAADPEAALARLDGAAARVAELRAALAADLRSIAEATATLAAQIGAARDELAETTRAAGALGENARALGTTLAAASASAEELGRGLQSARLDAEAGAQAILGLAERIAAARAAETRDAGEALARLEVLLEAIAARAAETRAQLAEESGAIEASARIALAETGRAAALLGETVEAQAAALAAQAVEARRTLEQLGSEASQQVGRRLEALARAAEDVEARLARQLAATEAIGTSAERAFQLLDARLDHSASVSAETLEKMAGRVQAVHGGIDSMLVPLRAAREALLELETATDRLAEGTQAVLARLATEMPERAAAVAEMARAMDGEIAVALDRLERAAASAEALPGPIRESQAAFEAAALGFERQRESVKIAGEALVVELEQARQLIAEVEQATEATSLAAATRLVDAMTRVREVAQQTTGTLREMLAGVIGEARESLAHVADEAMRRSFAGPIAEQAGEAAEAARAAAERTAASMAALAATIVRLEGRASSTRVDLEEAAQRELAAAAAFLGDQLASASVSIASALGQPMSDEDWTRWRKGERTMFQRRAVRLLDKADRARLQTLIAQNPAFADAARAYTAGFDALLARFERAGAPGVATALLDSDSGRLAAALTEALEG